MKTMAICGSILVSWLCVQVQYVFMQVAGSLP